MDVQVSQPDFNAPNSSTPAPLRLNGLLGTVEALLRDPYRLVERLRHPGSGRLVFTLLQSAILCSLLYGLVAGTFSGGTQLWAAPVKITGVLLLAALACLPTLFIFACLGGVKATCIEVAGLTTGLLALMSLLLIGFAPIAWVFSQSTELLFAMGGLHIFFGAVAVIFGLRFLHAGFLYFKAPSRWWLHFWCIIFLTVMLQMTATLRPLIGSSDTFLPREKKLFLVHWVDCMMDAVASKSNSKPLE